MSLIKSASSISNIAEYLRITYGFDSQTAHREAKHVIDKLTFLRKDLFSSPYSKNSGEQLQLSVYLTHQTVNKDLSVRHEK